MLTKPDLVDVGAENEVVKIVKSPEEYKVKKGFTMVKLRSQAKINAGQPLPEAIAEESDWFRKHRHFG